MHLHSSTVRIVHIQRPGVPQLLFPHPPARSKPRLIPSSSRSPASLLSNNTSLAIHSRAPARLSYASALLSSASAFSSLNLAIASACVFKVAHLPSAKHATSLGRGVGWTLWAGGHRWCEWEATLTPC